MSVASNYLASVAGQPKTPKKKTDVPTRELDRQGIDGEEVKRRAAAGEPIVQSGLRTGSDAQELGAYLADFGEGVVKGTASIAAMILDVARMSGPGGMIRAKTEGPLKITRATNAAIEHGFASAKKKAGLDVEIGPAGIASEFIGEIVAPGPEAVAAFRSAGKVGSRVDDLIGFYERRIAAEADDGAKAVLREELDRTLSSMAPEAPKTPVDMAPPEKVTPPQLVEGVLSAPKGAGAPTAAAGDSKALRERLVQHDAAVRQADTEVLAAEKAVQDRMKQVYVSKTGKRPKGAAIVQGDTVEFMTKKAADEMEQRLRAELVDPAREKLTAAHQAREEFYASLTEEPAAPPTAAEPSAPAAPTEPPIEHVETEAPPAPPAPKPPGVDLAAARLAKEDPLKKITVALRDAKPLRREQEAIYTAERSERIRTAKKAGEEFTGEEAYRAKVNALRGDYTKVQFESLRSKIGQDDIDHLYNMIEDAPDLRDWEKVTAGRGLSKMFGAYGGHVPQSGEIKILRKVFGGEFTDELLTKRPMLEKFKEMGLEVANIPRAIMSSFDLSAPLRQGAFFIGRPRQFFPAFKDMFRAFGSEKAYQAIEETIRANKSFDLANDAGLALTDFESIASREEAFATSLAEQMPVVEGSGVLKTPARLAAKGYNATVGRGVRASGRAYTGFLTKLRMDVFDDLVTKARSQGLDPDTDGKLATSIARFVNAGTGRGELAKFLKPADKVLNAFFFSPKLAASRLSFLVGEFSPANPKFYLNQPAFVRKEALKSLLSFMGVGGTVVGMAKASGAEVETDPRSSDFGKIRIGDTRLDVWGGFQQYVRMIAQLLTGEYKSATSGRMYELGDGFKARSRYDIALRQIESKEAPIPSLVTTVLRQQDYRGRPVSIPGEVGKRLMPMLAQDLHDLAKSDPKLLPMIVPAIFGASIQTFETSTKPKRKTAADAGPSSPPDQSLSLNDYLKSVGGGGNG